MDIQTLNKEEFDKLHPSMKEFLYAGIDTNRYGNNIVSEKNFFNMNLFNSDPEELDPDLLKRTEEARQDPNYFVEGFKTGISHGAELFGSIPGGLDRFYDWGRQTLGYEPTLDSIFDHAENYLKDIAHDLGPEYRNFAKPEGFVDKFVYGLGQAIPTIATYIPFIRATAWTGKGLQAMQGIGKLAKTARGTGRFLSAGSSLPAGISITDMTREIDDGKLSDVAMAGAYGYGIGRVLNVANKFNITPRMATLGTVGWLSAGWEANSEDRLASAAVWATLGVFGPLTEGKPIKRQLTELEVRTKQLMGEIEKPTLVKERINDLNLQIKDAKKQFEESPAPTEKGLIQQKNAIDKLEKELVTAEKLEFKGKEEPVRHAAAEQMFKNEGIIRSHKEILKLSEEASKFQKANEKRLEEGKEPLPVPEKFTDTIMSTEQIAKHKKYIKDLETEQVAWGKIVWTNNNYNQAIFGFDKRPADLFKQDMYNKDGSLKYKDMRSTILPDILGRFKEQETKGAALLIPPKFIKHPLAKYINDQISINKQMVDTKVEMMLYDPMFAADKIFLPGKKASESFSDYLLKINSPFEVLRLAGMRKVKTDGGSNTRFTLLRLRDPKKAAKIVNEAYKIEIDKLREAKKNKEDYSTRIDLNEIHRREAKKDLTPDEIRRIEELESTRTPENSEIINSDIFKITGQQRKDPFLPRKEGGFKYEVTDRELTNKYKFDQEMIDIYRSLRGVVDKTADSYNKDVKNNKANGLDLIQKVPNYFPHIFTGDFVVFLKKWSGKKKGYQPIDAPGAGNKFSAEALVKYMKEEHGALDVTGTKFNNKERLSSDYVVQIAQRDRSPVGSEAVIEFNRLFNKFDLTDEVYLKFQERVNEARKKTGFKKFSLQRIGVGGYLGSRLHARQEFVRQKLGRKLAERDLDSRQAADFEQSISTYVRGGLEAGNRINFNTLLGKILNEPVTISDGKGGLKKTTLSKDYPNAAELAENLKANAYGELRPGKLVEKLSTLGSDYIGKSGLTRILGGANQVTLTSKLLFGNMRFLLANLFQPYHMIPPRLFDLQYKGFDKGQVALAHLKALKDIFFPNKEMKEVTEFMYRNGVVDQKFLNEASADIKGVMGTTKLPGGMRDPLGREVFDFSRLLKVLTLQDFAGKVEQVSRLNASLTFYNFFRSAGKTKEQAMEMAAYNANKYMVEYNYLEQPGIYGNRGIGPLGKPFGLFKTFQHNYLAQLAQYITTARETGQTAGLTAFLAQMVFTAGIFGVVGYDSMERILGVLSPKLEKLTGKPLPSVTEMILTSDMPDVFKYGVPSSVTGMDLTATLAAPGVSVGDLISVPSLDYLGLNPLNRFAQGKGRGIIPTGFNYIMSAIAGDTPVEKKENWVKFLLATAPTSMQGQIEQYYNDLPRGYWKYWTPSKEFKDLHKMGKYLNVTRDPFKKGRGVYRRNFQDWFARTMSAYSVEEREALKLVYVTTRLKKNLTDDISGYLTAAAKYLMTDGFIPLAIIDRLEKYGLNFSQIYERVTNRVDLMNTTILERLVERTNTLHYNDRVNKLRDMALSRGFQSQY